ncbi:MAG: 5'-methylthioadenosine phosphorylase [Desulfurococcales archaeon ex4484_217_2]|nr:MAG: 5'-methylthioadenosine phosphorylase [Desulfurococcales archaeon ex4484_217_2]
MSGPPFHIKSKPGEIAERVIIAGDPARVEQVSKMLENPRVVNTNRGFLTYTGKYRGVPITVATHGIGGPSAAIVFEELRMLGAKVVVRLGTCGGLIKELSKGDIVIATGAAYYTGGNAIGMYAHEACMPTAPHHEVTSALVSSAEEHGVKYFLGPVISSDAFYAEDPDFAKKWSERGVIAVEMECAALFALGWMRNVKTGALLVVSDSLVKPEEASLADAKELKERVNIAAKIVLDALVKVKT